jgi:hypothetical protein
MDTKYDFISPEFLNILFFQQKNLVLFPYIDLKHIHSIDCFTVGYDVVDLDSTVLHNLREIIEFESSSTYSQQPTFYYILNAKVEDIKILLESPNIHCVINTHENVEHLANGDKFIFYNKKNNLFLNYAPERVNLSFEQHLIQTSQNEQILLDEILKIKSVATKIFVDLNELNKADNLPKLMCDYDQIYWDKILTFTRLYYKIQIPKFERPKKVPQKKFSKSLKDFSSEYEDILKTNRKIGQEFIKLLHNYRFNKVNSANLEVEQLYYPKKLYNYLRNHHWEKGIPADFLSKWVQMIDTKIQTNENDLLDFQIIFDKLKIPLVYLPEVNEENKPHSNSPNKPINSTVSIKNESVKGTIESIPSVEDFQEFKSWLLKKLDDLETIL